MSALQDLEHRRGFIETAKMSVQKRATEALYSKAVVSRPNTHQTLGLVKIKHWPHP